MAQIIPIHRDPSAAWLAQARIVAREALLLGEVPYGPTLVAAINVLGRSDSPGDRRLRGRLLVRIAADSLSGGDDAGATGGEAA